MNVPTNCQMILGADGRPAFVVVPYEHFRAIFGVFNDGNIPHDVMSAIVDGAKPIVAWREYLCLTQSDVAKRMGVTQAAYAQMEAVNKPRIATLIKIANALGLSIEQISFN